MAFATFVLLELNHKTRRWVGIEYSETIGDILTRLEYWRTNNGGTCDYKIVVVPAIPT